VYLAKTGLAATGEQAGGLSRVKRHPLKNVTHLIAGKQIAEILFVQLFQVRA
jgi:hypothetical protein